MPTLYDKIYTKKCFSFLLPLTSKSKIFEQSGNKVGSLNRIYATKSKGHLLYRDFQNSSTNNIRHNKINIASMKDLSSYLDSHFSFINSVLMDNNNAIQDRLNKLSLKELGKNAMPTKTYSKIAIKLPYKHKLPKL